MSTDCRRRTCWVLVVVLLLAWGLRLPVALGSRLHPDEALYGTWGLLIASGRDAWLAERPVYKPPLLPYLIAGAQALFGDSELSVRLPGLASGVLAVSAVAALSSALYRDPRVMLAAAVGMAFSPLAVYLFSSAFTDPVMVAAGIGACAAAARGYAGWAGVLGGLAFATKQTGLVWVPLVLGLGQACASGLGWRVPRFAGGFLLVAVPPFAWDAVRMAQGATSFWSLGVSGYGGLRLIWPQDLWERLRGWADQLHGLFSSPVVDGVLLLGLPALLWRGVARRAYARGTLVDLLLISFVVIHFFLHWLWAFPIWDRYLLPVVPVLALLLARLAAAAVAGLQSAVRSLFLFTSRSRSVAACRSTLAAGCLVLAALLVPALGVARDGCPGGACTAYDGIDEVAAFLGGLPEGTVVYEHWMGWQYGYYLFDDPLYLAHWPNPAWLARDVLVFGTTDARYIAFPAWESSARVERALAEVGYRLEPVLATVRRDGIPTYSVYRIQSRSSE
jgi:4-amino-4-deoxy-L-arabinose transferase-like glycosyltransferase